MTLFAVVGRGRCQGDHGRAARRPAPDGRPGAEPVQQGGRGTLRPAPISGPGVLEAGPRRRAGRQEHDADASIGAGKGAATTIISLRGASLGRLFRTNLKSGSMAALSRAPPSPTPPSTSTCPRAVRPGQARARRAGHRPDGGVYDSARSSVGGRIWHPPTSTDLHGARPVRRSPSRPGARRTRRRCARSSPTPPPVPDGEADLLHRDQGAVGRRHRHDPEDLRQLLGLAIVIALFGNANTLTLLVVERTTSRRCRAPSAPLATTCAGCLSVEALVMAVIGPFTRIALGVLFSWAATRSMADIAVSGDARAAATDQLGEGARGSGKGGPSVTDRTQCRAGQYVDDSGGVADLLGIAHREASALKVEVCPQGRPGHGRRAARGTGVARLRAVPPRSSGYCRRW